MFGATLVFHLASAIFILALLYRLIRGQQETQRLRDLIAATSAWQPAKVTIDWPARHLAGLCGALAIPFAVGEDAKGQGEKPAKVGAAKFMALYRQVPITHVQLGVDQPGLDIFYGARGGSEPLPAPEALAKELGVVAVRYCLEPS